MTRVVGVEQIRDGTIVVSSYSLTEAGFRVMNGWFRIFPSDASLELLGKAVIEASAAAATVVPVPDPGEVPLKPVLKAIGIRSVNRYMQDAKAVFLKFNDVIRVIPTKNCGKDGFLDVAEKEFSLDSSLGAVALGEAARKALDLAE